MYEVYADDGGEWILYEVGGGNFDVIGVFPDRANAEFAKAAFEQRAWAQTHLPVNGQQKAPMSAGPRATT